MRLAQRAADRVAARDGRRPGPGRMTSSAAPGRARRSAQRPGVVEVGAAGRMGEDAAGTAVGAVVAVAPAQQPVHDGPELERAVGQVQLVPARAVRAALDEALPDQRREPEREDRARDVQVGLQRAEAADAEEQVAHDEQRPALADDLERARQGAVLATVVAAQRHRRERSTFGSMIEPNLIRSAGMSTTPWWRSRTVVIAAGCLIAIITFGRGRASACSPTPLSDLRGWDRETFALAIAIQNLLWGLGQPFAGAIADRYGAGRVLAAGGAAYALGVALWRRAPAATAFALSGGVLIGLGLSGGSFTIVIAAFARLVPEDRRSWAMGLATAAGSMGQSCSRRSARASSRPTGRPTALVLLGGFVALVPILAGALSGRGPGDDAAAGEPPSDRAALRRASATRATCCSRAASSCAASTSRSSRRTCRPT